MSLLLPPADVKCSLSKSTLFFWFSFNPLLRETLQYCFSIYFLFFDYGVILKKLQLTAC